MTLEVFHSADRIGCPRAAILGANDGIVSTASLILGVAGAMSMAAGEYVSVSSQADTEAADLAREQHEQVTSPAVEREELAGIYVARGCDVKTAHRVADQLKAHDALAAHARNELGIVDMHRARPVQAAVSSAASFAVAAPRVLVSALTPAGWLSPVPAIRSVALLTTLGGIAARTGGASAVTGDLRVTFWGALAIAATYAAGALLGAAV